MGDVLLVVKDGADNQGFVLGTDDSESYHGYYAGGWVPNEWHHIAVTWSIPGMMKTYVDAVEVISHPSVPLDLISTIPPQLVVGRRDGYPEEPDAVFDELRISGIVRTPQEIAAFVLCLLSPAAAYMTVSAIAFDGGSTAGRL